MLVLTSRDGDLVMIGDQVVLTVIRSKRGKVRLGYAAPRDIKVLRECVAQRPPTDRSQHQLPNPAPATPSPRPAQAP
jgi:carbon storage regulator